MLNDMRIEKSEPLLRPVPGVPGFYRIDFDQQGLESLVSRHYRGNACVLRYHGENTSVVETLGDIFMSYRQQFVEKVPNANVYAAPVTVLEPSIPGPATFRIVRLARGLLVAYGDHFVASLSRRYGFWNVTHVALESQEYLKVRMGFDTGVRGYLRWDGEGLFRTDIFFRTDLQPLIRGADIQLFPERSTDNDMVIRGIWVSNIDDCIYAKVQNHKFRLTDGNIGSSWMVVECNEEDRLVSCAYYGTQMELKGYAWRLEMKPSNTDQN